MSELGDQKTVEVDYERIETSTPLAIKFWLIGPDGRSRIAWVPRSQIVELDRENKTMEVAEWVAIEKGLV